MKRTMLFLFLTSLPLWTFTQSWQVLEMPDAGPKWGLTEVIFIQPDLGYAIGNHLDAGLARMESWGVLLKYSSGKWSVETLPRVEGNWNLQGIFFSGPSHGWLVGCDLEKNTGLMFEYTENQWKRVELPALGFKEWKLYDVFFLKDGHGWAVGGAGQKSAVMLECKDGKWANIENEELFDKHTLVTIYASSPDFIWGAGFREGEFGKTMMAGQPYGSYMIHYDGKAWSEPKLPLFLKNVIWLNFKFLKNDLGWATGYTPPFQTARENGKIATYDGKKWTETKLSDPAKAWTLRDMDFADEKNGIAVGEFLERDHGLIMKYSKGSWAEWKSKELPEVSNKWTLFGIAWDGAGAYYAVGTDKSADKGIILKYAEK